MKFWTVLLLVFVLFISACAAPGEKREVQKDGKGALEGMPEEAETAAPEDGIFLTGGIKHTVPLDEIVWGCPRKDCIPSIDNPKFVPAGEAETEGLGDNDVVFGVFRKGIAKAYPQGILNWHEIVNDAFGDEAVLVTFCPLCDTAIAFERVVEAEAAEFGVSGRLRNNNLIMYDRKTDTLWSQVSGKGIMGRLAGEKLRQIPIETTYWKDWKAAYPDTLVLSRETGYFRDYDRYPYGTFMTDRNIYFPLTNEDNRLHPKEKVFGVLSGGNAKAYRETTIENKGIIKDKVGEQQVLVIWHPVSKGVLVFDPSGHSFVIEEGRLFDENGNEWDFEGMKKDKTEQLNRIDNTGAFWFSWAAEYPGTEIY